MNRKMNKQLMLVAALASLQPMVIAAMTDRAAAPLTSTAPVIAPALVSQNATTAAPAGVVSMPPASPVAPVAVASKGALKIAQEIKAGRHEDWVPRASSSSNEHGHWERVTPGAGNEGLVFDQLAAGDENTLWGVAKGALYQHTPKHGWKQRGRGVYVAVGSDGTVVSLDAAGNLSEYQGNKVKDADEAWELVPNIKLSSVAVIDKAAMWGVYATDEGNEVFQCKDGVWAPAHNILGEEAVGVKFISVNAQGILMGIRDDSSLVMFDMATKLPVVKPVNRKKGGKKNKNKKEQKAPGKEKPKMKQKKAAPGARAVSVRHAHKARQSKD